MGQICPMVAKGFIAWTAWLKYFLNDLHLSIRARIGMWKLLLLCLPSFTNYNLNDKIPEFSNLIHWNLHHPSSSALSLHQQVHGNAGNCWNNLNIYNKTIVCFFHNRKHYLNNMLKFQAWNDYTVSFDVLPLKCSKVNYSAHAIEEQAWSGNST